MACGKWVKVRGTQARSWHVWDFELGAVSWHRLITCLIHDTSYDRVALAARIDAYQQDARGMLISDLFFPFIINLPPSLTVSQP